MAAAYVYLAFTFPQPHVRIAMRTLPVVPVAIWTVFMDERRPLQGAPPGLRIAGQALLLVLTIVFAALVLGLGINWIFNPNRDL